MKPVRLTLFLLLFVARLGGTSVATADTDVTFFLASDQHFGIYTASNEAGNKLTVDRMNALPGTAFPATVGGGIVDTPRGVIATGDLTYKSADPNQAMFGYWSGDTYHDGWADVYGLNGEGRLNYPVFEGWGNHDVEFTQVIKDAVKARNPLRSTPVNISSNGYHYSWDWDQVHFVNLNEFPAYGTGHYTENSLGFLEEDLATHVGTSWRPVVIYHHENPSGQEFFDVAKHYNVIAIFHGHLHEASHSVWRGIDVYGVPRAGEHLSPEGFTAVQITDEKMIVANRMQGSWDPDLSFEKTFFVPGGMYLDTFTRGDSFDPGMTEVGMSGTTVDRFAYGKGDLSGTLGGWSSGGVQDEKLYMNRRQSGGHQVIVMDSDFPDLTMSTTMNWDFDQSEGPYDSVKDALGFWLRKPSAEAGKNTANNHGGVSVHMLASGAFHIQENVNGSEETVYADNPFKTISSPGNPSHMGTFANGGPLPTQWNGLPFDLDEDGALERDEPYRVGARLEGTSLDILINGLEVDLNGALDGTSLTLSGDGTASPTGENLVSFFRGDYSYGHGCGGFHDDFEIIAPGMGVILGDLDGDGFVGGADLDIVRSFWGQTVTPGNKLHGDPSGDGFVGGDDLDEVRAHWGEGTPPAPSGDAVPEPSTLALLGIGLFVVTCMKRTHTHIAASPGGVQCQNGVRDNRRARQGL